MIHLDITKTVNTAHFGPIEPGSEMVVPSHLAYRLMEAGFAVEHIEQIEAQPDYGDSGILAEFADQED